MAVKNPSVIFSLSLCIGVAVCSSPAYSQVNDSFGLPPDSAGQPSMGQPAYDPEQAAREKGLNEAIDSAMPLTPDQVKKIISRMSETQEATALSLQDPTRPKAELKVETVSLDPGTAPPVIKVAAGYVTTVVMMDATGAPWPIEDMAFAGRFDIKTAQRSSHIFRIIPLNRFYEGNLTLQLRGLSAPVTFQLVAGKDVVFYRYDVRVPALGPKAKPPRFDSSATLVAGDSTLMAVLDGYPPAGAQRLKVMGLDDRSAAWDISGQTYLRTPHSLLSPAWSSSASSGDGTTVYTIPDTPVLLLSDQGVMVRARLTRPEGFVAGEAQ